MGRCQGGFCMPSLIEILAKELKIPFEKVTKKGKDSFMNMGLLCMILSKEKNDFLKLKKYIIL